MEKLGEILLKHKKITQKQLDFCLSIHAQNKSDRLGKIFIHYNLVNERDIAQAIAESLKWDLYSDNYSPDVQSIEELSLPVISEHLVFPVLNGKGTIFVMAFPSEITTTELIRCRYGSKVVFQVGTENEIRKAIENYVKEKSRSVLNNNNLFSLENIDTGRGNTWFSSLLDKAIAQEATDIHIEPTDLALEVRFRIDGDLHFIESLPINLKDTVANLVIIQMDLDTSEKLKPIDGRFTYVYLKREVDIRVSHIPTIHGSAFVLRLLDKSRTAISVTKLGFSSQQWGLLEKALERPHGINLITGPTGSGKTTTLYSILNHIKALNLKIITIEDPVEIRFPLITQVQVNETRCLSFSSAIRSFLRHDPDVLFIGEIRDPETAQEALRASITGHKVFSTLHTNTPVDAILRLRDLGVENAAIAMSLVSVTSQRLVRLLCPYCKLQENIKKEELLDIKKKYLLKDIQVVCVPNRTGVCKKCIDGYWSRTVVSEVLLIDATLRRLIDQNRLNDIYELIESSKDYRSIIQDASYLIADGRTSIEEAVKVLG